MVEALADAVCLADLSVLGFQPHQILVLDPHFFILLVGLNADIVQLLSELLDLFSELFDNAVCLAAQQHSFVLLAQLFQRVVFFSDRFDFEIFFLYQVFQRTESGVT